MLRWSGGGGHFSQPFFFTVIKLFLIFTAVDCKGETKTERGNCSATCGVGKREVKHMVLVTRKSDHGGKECEKNTTTIEACDTKVPCPGDIQRENLIYSSI